MYNVFKSVILNKSYELNSMLVKIDTVWAQGQLSDTQRTELIKLARENADPGMSVDLLARLEDHETRLRALEMGDSKPEPGPNPEEPMANAEYPAYVQGQTYRSGDKVTYHGKKYICTLNEYTEYTSFNPEAYPGYWEPVNG